MSIFHVIRYPKLPVPHTATASHNVQHAGSDRPEIRAFLNAVAKMTPAHRDAFAQFIRLH